MRRKTETTLVVLISRHVFWLPSQSRHVPGASCAPFCGAWCAALCARLVLLCSRVAPASVDVHAGPTRNHHTTGGDGRAAVEPTMQRCTAAAQMMRRPKARFAAARGAGGAAASGGPAQRQLTTVTTLSRCPRPPAGTQRGGTAHRAEMWYGYGVILGCGGRISFAHGWLLGCCRSRQAAIGRPSVHQYACRCQRVEMKGPRWRPRCNHHLQQMSLPLPDLHSPVLLADHRGRTPPLCLDVLGAP
ncbi:hypothetical protein VFPBJ_04664 [Purpureocillium lilacinum]|uniref:Uncharacterized protein n=1 Tax=Purpureocillium lilacinum TaxID=33203 RepID=A0A179GXQ5_PURLI|nr:hypothetical protein VFPBJ_04664 [Purpureocillium lilacinum]